MVISWLTIVCVSFPVYGQTGFKDLALPVFKDPAPGYFFIAPNAVDSFSVLDHAGKNMFRTYTGQHTNALPYNFKWFSHFTILAQTPVFIRRDIERKIIDTLRYSGTGTTDFHECRIITDTSYLILGNKEHKMDLSGIIPGGKTDATVLENIVQERTFSGVTLFEWKSLDHIPVTDATEDVQLDVAYVDYIHINSIVKDDDGNLLISCRHLDEVIKINRQSGAVMWRLGGTKSKNNQFSWLNDTFDGFVGFSHQHTVTRTSAGTILMFDNGNLKPEPQRSRAVEYEVDENAKTVKRVFEFRPTPDIYSNTMGSAQELENGSILIGYGSATSSVIAHEVSRDGVVQVKLENPAVNGFTPYRVLKQAMFMTGAYRRITTFGNVSFTRSDSNTHLSISLTRVDDTTSAVAERHSYPPHDISFTNDVSCGVLPTRWVFRAKDSALIAGTMTFEIGAVPGVVFPDQIKLYHRAKEGKEDFSPVVATYSAATKCLTVNKLMYGEFLIGYAKCFSPRLITPENYATEEIAAPKLEWTDAVSNGEYQVELSKVQTFATNYARFSTRRLDTTLSNVADFTKLYWRVRGKLPTGYGPWSDVFQFTTRLGIVTIISPTVVAKDTIAVQPSHVFRWSAVTGAQQYRVLITGFGSPIVAIDTVLTTNSFSPGTKLFPVSKFTWYVRALSDTIVGRPSTQAFFVTSPPAPRLVTPPFDAVDVATDRPLFVWDQVQGAIRYVVTVKRLVDSSVIAKDSSNRPPLTIASLPIATRSFWTCHAVGQYGPGPDQAPSPFTTNSTTVLPASSTINPNRTGNVDTMNVRFTWTSVPLASFYDFQLTSKQSFKAPDLEIFRITETSCTAPTLKPGTTYGWRVIAYNNTASGRWSDTASFTTTSRPSQGLTPLVPISGSTNVPLAGVFSYTTSRAFDSYGTEVSRSVSFEAPDFQFLSNNGTCAYYGLLGGTDYFWRAVGKTNGKPNEFGSPSRFTTLVTTGVQDKDSGEKGVITAYFVGNNLVINTALSPQLPYKARLYTIQGSLVLNIDQQVLSAPCVALPTIGSGVYYLELFFEGQRRSVVSLVKN